ncbi:MAG TPA: NAD-dependent epimerase/dehydratase family protein [Acidobacteriaceae bacterium]|jgi:nucleoside-diphosphate-sugar epimerase|nr:NAD-dependent epimerase/dehydratase family protein [Acidobacteriaceae bacterium]
MPTIALVGGNSQVATEVALFLRVTSETEVVPVCRSVPGSAFLRHCGFTCRIGDMTDPETARRMLEGVDLAVDFSRSDGTAGEIRRRMTASITNLVRYSPAGCRLAYTSTEMAFGLGAGDTHLRSRAIARTTYGATKRYAEKLIQRLAAQAGKEAYVLRLGQVHGELQSVSAGMRARFRENRPLAMPNSISDTVFAYTIAEALLHIAEGRERPSLYTLMSTPDWHWEDIYRFYSAECGVDPPLMLYSVSATSFLRRSTDAVRGAAKAMLLRNREVIGSNLLWRLPRLEQRMFARYRAQNAEKEILPINSAEPLASCRPVVGAIPGARLTSLSDSRITMEMPARQVREMLTQASERLKPSHRSIGDSSHSSLLPF